MQFFVDLLIKTYSFFNLLFEQMLPLFCCPRLENKFEQKLKKNNTYIQGPDFAHDILLRTLIRVIGNFLGASSVTFSV